MPSLLDITKFGYSILQIETCDVCNIGCGFCPYPKRGEIGKLLPTEVVKNIIDSIDTSSNSFKYLSFHQINEPLLDHRIYDFIQYAKKKKIRVNITTNGTLFYKSKRTIDRLTESAPDYIKVSFQNLDENHFVKHQGFHGSFQEFKRGVFDFCLAINNSSSCVAIDIGCNFQTLLNNLKSKTFGLQNGDPFVRNNLREIQADLKSFLKEFSEYTGFKIDTEINISKISPNYLDQEGIPITQNIFLKIKPFYYGRSMFDFYPTYNKRCGTFILGILADGSVVPCCRAFDKTLSMGNLKEDSLRNILEKNIQILNNIRTGRDMHPFCQKCLGEPTQRGVFFKKVKHSFWKMTHDPFVITAQ